MIKTKNTMLLVVAVVLLVVLAAGWRRRPAFRRRRCPPIKDVPPFRFDGRVVRRVARTSKEIRKGLGGFLRNDDDTMLFVNAYESPLTYTLAPMKVPLTIEFFDHNRDRVEQQPRHGGHLVRSQGPACYVLETIQR